MCMPDPLVDAATSGDVAALLSLADRCWEGDPSAGLPADPEEAVRWYEQAAEHDVLATVEHLRALGRTTAESLLADPDRSLQWFRLYHNLSHRARQEAERRKLEELGLLQPGILARAESGDVAALLSLADLYWAGDASAGFPADWDKAARLYKQAAEHDIRATVEHLSALYQTTLASLFHLAENLPPSDQERLHVCSHLLDALSKRAAAESGNVDAMVALGDLYRKGDVYAGYPADPREAIRWYERAAEHDNLDALDRLVDLSGRLPDATPDDLERMRQWRDALLRRMLRPSALEGLSRLRADAESGDVHAMLTLSDLYRRGDPYADVPVDPEAAVRWCTRAAEADHTPAMLSLARLFETGMENLPADPQRAAHWYEQAHAHDAADAAALPLAKLHDENGPLFDPEAAIRWYWEAAKHGNPAARERLDHIRQHGLGHVPAEAKARRILMPFPARRWREFWARYPADHD